VELIAGKGAKKKRRRRRGGKKGGRERGKEGRREGGKEGRRVSWAWDTKRSNLVTYCSVKRRSKRDGPRLGTFEQEEPKNQSRDGQAPLTPFLSSSLHIALPSSLHPSPPHAPVHVYPRRLSRDTALAVHCSHPSTRLLPDGCRWTYRDISHGDSRESPGGGKGNEVNGERGKKPAQRTQKYKVFNMVRRAKGKNRSSETSQNSATPPCGNARRGHSRPPPLFPLPPPSFTLPCRTTVLLPPLSTACTQKVSRSMLLLFLLLLPRLKSPWQHYRRQQRVTGRLSPRREGRSPTRKRCSPHPCSNVCNQIP